MKKGSKKVEPAGGKIYYYDEEQIKDPKLLETPRISFYASGRIYHAEDRLLSKPIRVLKEQNEL